MFSAVWTIGFQALDITNDAEEMSLSGAGIALNINPNVNPSSILWFENPYISFSQTSWFGGVSGQKMQLVWNRKSPKLFYIEKLGLDDIELRDEIPQDEPLGQFGTYWVSTRITTGYRFSGFDFGVSLRGSYTRLYHYSAIAFSADFGITKKLSNLVNTGLIIKNLGYCYSESLRNHLPTTVGFGISIDEPFVSSTVFADVMFSDTHGIVGYSGIIIPISKLKLISAVEYSSKLEHLAISSGFSFSHRKWGLQYSIKLHSSEVLGIPHSVDIIWYY